MSQELEEVRRRLAELRDERDYFSSSLGQLNSTPFGFDAEIRRVQREELQKFLSEKSAKIDELELRERQLLDNENAREAAVVRAEAEAKAKAELDERSFWFRRFHTSLAIANGGALAVSANKLFDRDLPDAVLGIGAGALVCFILGLVLSGGLPILLTNHEHKRAEKYATASGLLFVIGLLSVFVAFAAFVLLKVDTDQVRQRATASLHAPTPGPAPSLQPKPAPPVRPAQP